MHCLCQRRSLFHQRAEHPQVTPLQWPVGGRGEGVTGGHGGCSRPGPDPEGCSTVLGVVKGGGGFVEPNPPPFCWAPPNGWVCGPGVIRRFALPLGNREKKNALCNHWRSKSPRATKKEGAHFVTTGAWSPKLNAGNEIWSGKQMGRKLFNMSLAHLRSPKTSQHFEYKHMR